MRKALFTKLHARYKFLKLSDDLDYNTNEYPGNPVNKAALTTMSTALASWRNRVKKLIDKGIIFEEIQKKNPTLTEDSYLEFKAWCESDAGKAMSKWGLDQRKKNIGNHNLGSGGYRGKKPIWAKEDADRERQCLPNPFDKFPDEQTRNLIRSRYRTDPTTNDLTTDPKVKELERLLVRNTTA